MHDDRAAAAAVHGSLSVKFRVVRDEPITHEAGAEKPRIATGIQMADGAAAVEYVHSPRSVFMLAERRGSITSSVMDLRRPGAESSNGGALVCGSREQTSTRMSGCPSHCYVRTWVALLAST